MHSKLSRPSLLADNELLAFWRRAEGVVFTMLIRGSFDRYPPNRVPSAPMKSSLKLFCAVLLASFGTFTASAVPVTLGSNVYDVVAYTPNASSTSILSILEDQPWWGDWSLASSAAQQVNSQLGSFYLNQFGWGPFFAVTNGQGAFWQGDQNQVSSVGWSTSYEGFSFAIVNTNSSVPDGGATIALVGTSLLGLAVMRRKFARA